MATNKRRTKEENEIITMQLSQYILDESPKKLNCYRWLELHYGFKDYRTKRNFLEKAINLIKDVVLDEITVLKQTQYDRLFNIYKIAMDLEEPELNTAISALKEINNIMSLKDTNIILSNKEDNVLKIEFIGEEENIES